MYKISSGIGLLTNGQELIYASLEVNQYTTLSINYFTVTYYYKSKVI